MPEEIQCDPEISEEVPALPVMPEERECERQSGPEEVLVGRTSTPEDIAPEELGAVGGSEPALTLSTQLKESEERVRAEERMRRHSLLIAELRAEVSSLTAERDTLMQAHALRNNLPTFPLRNVGEFDRLEAHLLLCEEMREKLKQSFLQLEADDAKSFVRKALRSVLPDGVAGHFTLRGTLMKRAIGQSLFIKTIRDAVMEKFPNTDPHSLSNFISKHFCCTVSQKR
ncbi:uncharacterized protein LOC119685006 [Teleopsis dalmanni]|uniref:uncharacterized protein LOC119685006 n=1 Tax=Teleopsis dalmanni TaxID=139649 RepID=UPI0018CD8E49|nr:uncharacterized protein LOC119685006 [Teleopsis dalmanni]